MVLFFVRLLVRLALWKYPAQTFGRPGVAAYMVRHYLLGGPDHLKPRSWWRGYLNNIRRSDSDTALHNHPWRWAISFPLINGYDEERLTPRGVVKRRVKPWRPWAPWRVNFIRGETFHRLETNYGEAWTLFIVPGRLTQDWGFLDLATGRFRPGRASGSKS